MSKWEDNSRFNHVPVLPSSLAPHKTVCDNLGSIVITYGSVSKRLLTLDVEASMGPDGFHPKLLSSCQAVAYPI